MTIAWMLYAVAIGTMLAIAAVSAEWAFKSAKQAVRFVWAGAIAVTLLLSMLAPLRATSTRTISAFSPIALVDVPMMEALKPTVPERIVARGRAMLDLLAWPVTESMDAATAAPAIANRSARVMCVLSASLALVALFGAYNRSMRESRRWPRVHLLGRTVRLAPDVGPAVMGIAPPEIVIPRWVLMRSFEAQCLVLEHESEHVRAHDPLMLLFACLAVALMPWNPAVWFMWSRLRLAVEVDCDRRVLLRGVQKLAYGELLVELSARRPWNSLAMPAFSWGTSHLEKRLVAMTARPVRFGIARRMACSGVIAVALVTACNAEMPTAAQVQAMDVNALASRVPLRDSDSTLYFVNDRAVSKADAQAVGESAIASIEIQRASRMNPVSRVHVKLVSDSTRKLRIASGSDSSRIGEPPDAANAQSAVTLQGDSTILQMRPMRALSRIPEDKAIAVRDSERQLMTNGDAITLKTDSGLTQVYGSNLKLSYRDPSCLPEGSVAKTASGSRIRIRGQASVPLNDPSPACAAGAPLLIVNGVIINPGGPGIESLNPDNIESVEVIKGAAAERLYGARGVNGVISIKLKN